MKSNDDKKIELNLLIKYKFEKKLLIFFSPFGVRVKNQNAIKIEEKNKIPKFNDYIMIILGKNLNVGHAFEKKFQTKFCQTKKIVNFLSQQTFLMKMLRQ